MNNRIYIVMHISKRKLNKIEYKNLYNNMLCFNKDIEKKKESYT